MEHTYRDAALAEACIHNHGAEHSLQVGAEHSHNHNPDVVGGSRGEGAWSDREGRCWSWGREGDSHCRGERDAVRGEGASGRSGVEQQWVEHGEESDSDEEKEEGQWVELHYHYQTH